MSVEQAPFEATLARAVLRDCEAALQVLKENPRGVYWRLAWCSAVTLLRAVGHVLVHEMQAPNAPPGLREAAKEWWSGLKKTKPEPAIFWRFIEDDRNALLKEYRFSAEQGIIVRSSAIGTLPFGAVPFGANVREPTYFMKNGPFAGRDQRDVVKEAITWWDKQLADISVRAAVPCMIEKRAHPAPET